MVLAFLNLGPGEMALLVVLFVLLFGADRLPAIARTLGKARTEFDRAQREFRDVVETEEERVLAEQLAFEAERERAMAQQTSGERASLARAAEELGIEPGDKGEDELRHEIRLRLGTEAAPGRNDSTETGTP